MPAASARIMAYDFDALRQAERWAQSTDPFLSASDARGEAGLWRSSGNARRGLRARPALAREFVGVLRTAALFSGELLVTDSQLLDGVFFQAFGPTAVLGAMADSGRGAYKLRVTGRRDTLANSLRAFLASPDGTFNPLYLSTLAAAGIDQNPQALGQKDAHRILEAEDAELTSVCASALEQALDAPPGSLHGLGESWQAWIDAERAGLIAHERLSGMTADEFERTATRFLGTMPGTHPDLCHRLTGERRRSAALTIIEAAQLPPDEVDQVTTWYETVYQSALAEHLSADWLVVRGSHQTASVAGGPGSAGALSLGGKAHEVLGEMPGAEFERLLFRHRDAIAAWRQERDARSTERVAYAIDTIYRQQSLAQERRQTRTSLFGVLLLAILTFALDAISVLNTSLALVIPVVALLIAVVPVLVRAVRHQREMRSYANTNAVIFLQPSP